jgi:hypothetical protein
MTTRRQSATEVAEQNERWQRELEQVIKERDLRMIIDAEARGLRTGLINALLIVAGIIGAAGLLYFRAQVWAWAIGDPVAFVVVMVVLAIGSLLTIRAARERSGRDRDGVEP